MPRQLRLTRALNGVGQTNTDMVDSACFSLYFQDTGSRALIQRRHLNITRLEMIRKLVQRVGRPQWTVCREPEQESREAQSKKEKGKNTLDRGDLWNDCTLKLNNMFLIFSTFVHYSLLALVKTEPPCLCGHEYKPVFASRQPLHTSHFFLTATSLNKSWLLINMHTTVCTSTAWALFLECQTHLTWVLPCE